MDEIEDSVIAMTGAPLMGQTPISENTSAKYKASYRYSSRQCLECVERVRVIKKPNGC